jgi:hypothetical protein
LVSHGAVRREGDIMPKWRRDNALDGRGRHETMPAIAGAARRLRHQLVASKKSKRQGGLG